MSKSSSRAVIGAVVAGKYKLVERLGGGGMGEVFRAEHLYAGRTVALKLLRRDFADDPELTARFFQEAQAVNKIRHPNIVDVLDAGLADEGPYVAMELLEGASLSATLAKVGRLDAGAAIAIVLPMLDALEAAHRAGIVHRDLKPENVILARGNANGPGVLVKIVDFGIAKVLDSGAAPRTHTGVVFGTPDYLSPEQASGEGVVDGRSDLFAVGIVLFELIAGRRPFEAATAIAIAYKIVNERAPTLASLGVHCDPRLQGALDVALAKLPEERFASASSFADMLAPLARDGATRRAQLEGLIDGSFVIQPTVAAPPMATALPRDGVSAEAVSVLPPTPLAPPTPPPMVPATMVSYDLVRARTTSDPALREVAGLREKTSEAPRLSPLPRILTPPAPPPRRTPISKPLASTPMRPPATSSSSRALRATTWTPRPLPSSVRGRCHTRGSFTRAVAKWIDRIYGETKVNDVLAVIPSELADTFRRDGFNALVWYDIEALDTFLDATTSVVLGGDATMWRSIAREQFEHELGPIFRPGTRATEPATVLKRSPVTWQRLLDFGSMRVSEPTGETSLTTRALVRIDGFEAASLALRHATMGAVEGLVVSSGASHATARILSGEASFVREFEFEVAWPSRK